MNFEKKQDRRVQPRNLKRQQGGFTLVELMIVTVLLAVAIAVVYLGVSSYMAKDRTNQEAKELPTIFANIQAKYSQRSNFTGATCTGLINLNVFPQSRLATATTLVNRWRGNITCAVATLTTASDVLNLTYTNVPATECGDLIPMVEGYVRVITVGGTTVKADNALTDLDALGTACQAGGQNNTIVYSVPKA